MQLFVFLQENLLTPLMQAVSMDCVDIARLLLTEGKADPNLRDSSVSPFVVRVSSA